MLAGDAGKYAKFEIEKKYLLAHLPKDVPNDFIEIQDKYLFNCSLRLRIERSSQGEIIARKLTKKDKAPEKDATISIITSLYLSENDFKALENLPGNLLRKRRYYREDDKNRFCFDVFVGPLTGLVLAEIEFLDETTCRGFSPKETDWIEVTHDQSYSGGILAARQVAPA